MLSLASAQVFAMRIAVLLVGGGGIVMNPASGLLRLKPCDEEFPSPEANGYL